MSAAQLAPGPWLAVPNSWQHTTIYDAKQMPVCRFDLADWGVDEDNQAELEKAQSAVARLIAAAPDMLKTLGDLDGWLANTNHDEDHPWRISIRAAIVKATGSAS